MLEELDGAVRNKVVFQEISRKLQNEGYSRDWEQCRTKIKNLKKEYRAVKDHNNETGRGRKTCKYFDELDEILGHRPASVPTILLDTGSSSQDADLGSAIDEKPNGNTTAKISNRTITYVLTLSTDGEDVEATSPVDSALIPQSLADAGPESSMKRSGDVRGVC